MVVVTNSENWWLYGELLKSVDTPKAYKCGSKVSGRERRHVSADKYYIDENR